MNLKALMDILYRLFPLERVVSYDENACILKKTENIVLKLVFLP